MAKKELTKADLMNEIQSKIQELTLLASAVKTDRSRKAETLEAYKQKYLELLKK
jgi:hypothetical protein